MIRVQLLSSSSAFTLIAAGVLLPLGLWLALGSQRLPPIRHSPSPRARRFIWLFSLTVGTVGGIYGIGGGSLLAPVLLALGFSAYEVAPATLAAAFLTSVAGIAGYRGAPSHPRWHDCPRLGAASVPWR
ncbi:MAG: TSUP family transporter [Solirubrobacteraceae bacterium]